MLARLENHMSVRLTYRKKRYWQLYLNTSEIAFFETPRHYDLVLYIHPDHKEDTILSVVEALDIGKVNSIDILETKHVETPEQYQNKVMWKHANPIVWKEKMDVKYNIVKIRFDYWFKTKSTYNFQNTIYCKHFIDIPVFQGTFWTFYYEAPKFEGINPYIWYNDTV
jgi:hypothetical protein